LIHPPLWPCARLPTLCLSFTDDKPNTVPSNNLDTFRTFGIGEGVQVWPYNDSRGQYSAGNFGMDGQSIFLFLLLYTFSLSCLSSHTDDHCLTDNGTLQNVYNLSAMFEGQFPSPLPTPTNANSTQYQVAAQQQPGYNPLNDWSLGSLVPTVEPWETWDGLRPSFPPPASPPPVHIPLAIPSTITDYPPSIPCRHPQPIRSRRTKAKANTSPSPSRPLGEEQNRSQDVPGISRKRCDCGLPYDANGHPHPEGCSAFHGRIQDEPTSNRHRRKMGTFGATMGEMDGCGV
jgi:hypothetical protein